MQVCGRSAAHPLTARALLVSTTSPGEATDGYPGSTGMGVRMVGDVGWDGGWEDAVDEGEGLEDLMLGPVPPYDLPSSYVPASRWGSRHEIARRPFADPIDLVEQGEVPKGQRLRPTPAKGRRAAAKAPKPGRVEPTSPISSRAAPSPRSAKPVSPADGGPLSAKRQALVQRCASELRCTEASIRKAVFSGGEPIWVHTDLSEDFVRLARSTYSRMASEAKRGPKPSASPAAKRVRMLGPSSVVSTGREIVSTGREVVSRSRPKKSKGGGRKADRAATNPAVICAASQQAVRIDGICGCS